MMNPMLKMSHEGAALCDIFNRGLLYFNDRSLFFVGLTFLFVVPVFLQLCRRLGESVISKLESNQQKMHWKRIPSMYAVLPLHCQK